ncbi:MAG: ribonuclease R [Planctomycetota bacterium]|jgi:ribonuclease R
MPEVFKRSIIQLLKHTDYSPLKLAQLAKALDVSSKDYPQFKAAFDQLRAAGHVVIGAGKLVSLRPLSDRVVGTFRANPKGFGFVIPPEPSDGDLFIPPNATAEAMTGDTVVAKVVKRGRREGQMRYSGRIVEILQRAQNRFVGTLLKGKGGWFVQPDGACFTEPINIEDVSAKGAAQKDKVVVELLSYPRADYLAQGVIIEVLGRAGAYESEIKAIIHQYHLADEFDEDCLQQSRRAASEFKPEQAAGREDITEKLIITIDPPDSKDFDDAISLEKNADGNWELGVHIADVSFFVGPSSPLDVEAGSRGNSVYLPGKTVPMLPEILSNGICSLQPGQKRFAKSAYLTYDSNGHVLSRKFANSVIRSNCRLTYHEADRILKGHTKGFKPEAIELLKNMESLSRCIEKRRTADGMLHLDLPETELVMDKAGRVIDAVPADNSYPHTIIEMFMVEANEAVASVLDRLNIPLMRRIHPEPDSLSMKNLSRLVRALGLSLPRNPGPDDIQKLLAATEGKDCSLAVNLVVLRSLEKAQYAPLNIGHYALASSHYCHFTSPIRRYADLLVHRVLQCYLQGRLDSAKQSHVPTGQDLTETGKHISFSEQQAEDAERELKKVLILQMLSGHIGEQFEAVVTGLTNFGVFAHLKKFGIEGLIKTEDLGPDQWRYNSKAQCIAGVRSGVWIGLGRPIKVRIVSVNIPARQLNLAPAEALGAAEQRKTDKVKSRKERKGRKTRRRRGRN